jgi:hypothetical protein
MLIGALLQFRQRASTHRSAHRIASSLRPPSPWSAHSSTMPPKPSTPTQPPHTPHPPPPRTPQRPPSSGAVGRPRSAPTVGRRQSQSMRVTTRTRDGLHRASRHSIDFRTLMLLSPESSDADIWNRLTKTPSRPTQSRDISSVYDDVRNCTFKPVVSVAAQSLHQPPFMQRVPKYIQRFVELHNAAPAFSGDSAKTFTFRPHINHTAKLEQAVTQRGSFLNRLKSDLKSRAERKEQLQQMTLCTFQPSLNDTTKRKTARIHTPFLQRLSDDLDRREEHVRAQKRQCESVPFTFTPNISATNTEPPSFHNFLSRMVSDIDDREVSIRERCDSSRTIRTSGEMDLHVSLSSSFLHTVDALCVSTPYRSFSFNERATSRRSTYRLNPPRRRPRSTHDHTRRDHAAERTSTIVIV